LTDNETVGSAGVVVVVALGEPGDDGTALTTGGAPAVVVVVVVVVGTSAPGLFAVVGLVVAESAGVS
jgi:hypothetical protein